MSTVARLPVARRVERHVPWAWHRYRYAALAYSLAVVLLAVNIALSHGFFTDAVLIPLIAGAAPLVILTIASTVPMLAGNGGIDISVGPVAGLVNVVLIVGIADGTLPSSPALVIPAALGIGLVSGAVIGILVAYGRLAPIVVTLGAYLIYTALAQVVFADHGGTAPAWLTHLGDKVGPIPGGFVSIGVVIGLWLLLRLTPFYRYLYAVGDGDVAAYTAGVPVAIVRASAYAIAGLFAAIAGLATTGLISAGDPKIGPTLTLTAIAGAALGGTSLAGGRGGVLGAVAGGTCVYLIQNGLSLMGIDSYWVTFSFGAVLVIGIALNGLITGGLRRRGIA
jgi:ribose transport system permease protein